MKFETYGDVLAALVTAPADADVVVKTKTGTYRVVSARVDMDLGEHMKPEDVDQHVPERDRPAARKAVADCDGDCTEHRAMLSERRTVILTIERA